jgi:hypothetical protein
VVSNCVEVLNTILVNVFLNRLAAEIVYLPMYTLYNKNQALEIFKAPNWKLCKRTADVINPVIRNRLVFDHMRLSSAFH